eukprot:TRINITY_DN11357_c0_g2_i2.p1 TRINITY_DN11357_c0_g2~~TRINITY_DN11357_c0_g2_i2.p1  ORF type:complete len:1368 (+),score=358.05 TRINITY_DN11357_c0_g2_i2:75-4106(+)
MDGSQRGRRYDLCDVSAVSAPRWPWAWPRELPPDASARDCAQYVAEAEMAVAARAGTADGSPFGPSRHRRVGAWAASAALVASSAPATAQGRARELSQFRSELTGAGLSALDRGADTDASDAPSVHPRRAPWQGRLGTERGQGCAPPPGSARDPTGRTTPSTLLLPPCGYRNAGSTCYAGVLVQVLAGIGAFRRAVYALAASEPAHPATLELAKLLAAAQTCRVHSAHSLASLATAFGFRAGDESVQHNIQCVLAELLRVLLRDESAASSLLRRLFVFRRVARCVGAMADDEAEVRYGAGGTAQEVDAADWVGETVLELPYVELSTSCAETLEQCFRNQLLWGHSFTHFPPVLNLFLHGFEYSADTGTYRKAGKGMAFPREIDLAEVLAERREATEPLPSVADGSPTADAWAEAQAGSARYRLYAVVAHRGTMTSGHYVAFVAPNDGRQFWKCDDEHVGPCDARVAIDSLCGDDCDPAPYLLVYVQSERWSEVVADCPPVPPFLRGLCSRPASTRKSLQLLLEADAERHTSAHGSGLGILPGSNDSRVGAVLQLSADAVWADAVVAAADVLRGDCQWDLWRTDRVRTTGTCCTPPALLLGARVRSEHLGERLPDGCQVVLAVRRAASTPGSVLVAVKEYRSCRMHQSLRYRGVHYLPAAGPDLAKRVAGILGAPVRDIRIEEAGGTSPNRDLRHGDTIVVRCDGAGAADARAAALLPAPCGLPALLRDADFGRRLAGTDAPPPRGPAEVTAADMDALVEWAEGKLDGFGVDRWCALSATHCRALWHALSTPPADSCGYPLVGAAATADGSPGDVGEVLECGRDHVVLQRGGSTARVPHEQVRLVHPDFAERDEQDCARLVLESVAASLEDTPVPTDLHLSRLRSAAAVRFWEVDSEDQRTGEAFTAACFMDWTALDVAYGVAARARYSPRWIRIVALSPRISAWREGETLADVLARSPELGYQLLHWGQDGGEGVEVRAVFRSPQGLREGGAFLRVPHRSLVSDAVAEAVRENPWAPPSELQVAVFDGPHRISAVPALSAPICDVGGPVWQFVQVPRQRTPPRALHLGGAIGCLQLRQDGTARWVFGDGGVLEKKGTGWHVVRGGSAVAETDSDVLPHLQPPSSWSHSISVSELDVPALRVACGAASSVCLPRAGAYGCLLLENGLPVWEHSGGRIAATGEGHWAVYPTSGEAIAVSLDAVARERLPHEVGAWQSAHGEVCVRHAEATPGEAVPRHARVSRVAAVMQVSPCGAPHSSPLLTRVAATDTAADTLARLRETLRPRHDTSTWGLRCADGRTLRPEEHPHDHVSLPGASPLRSLVLVRPASADAAAPEARRTFRIED